MAAEGLTDDQVELFTDVMLSKLALTAVRGDGGDPFERPIRRDEVRSVIWDTTLLVTGAKEMDEWLENA